MDVSDRLSVRTSESLKCIDFFAASRLESAGDFFFAWASKPIGATVEKKNNAKIKYLLSRCIYFDLIKYANTKN